MAGLPKVAALKARNGNLEVCTVCTGPHRAAFLNFLRSFAFFFFHTSSCCLPLGLQSTSYVEDAFPGRISSLKLPLLPTNLHVSIIAPPCAANSTLRVSYEESDPNLCSATKNGPKNNMHYHLMDTNIITLCFISILSPGIEADHH